MCGINTKGIHDLIVIYRSREFYGATDVVRWCTTCGSIVVDKDFDGRTNAGQIMKMKFPTLKIKE